MKNRLKQLRVNAALTQAEIAEATGVSQPNYYRWESGSVPIPEDKLQKLAKVLKTSPEVILGRHQPIEAGFYDETASDDLSYYGEVAVHFKGSGAPLLLSISDAAFAKLHKDLQKKAEFVTVNSLANQTAIIRTKAIADLYFSSEAYDDYGPEHGEYTSHVNLQMPDARDWEIVEALVTHDDVSEFNVSDVQRVREAIMVTEQHDEPNAADRLKTKELEHETEKNQEIIEKIFEMTLITTYQLSAGQIRKVHVDEDRELFNAFYELTDYGDIDLGGDMIIVTAEGRHKIAFINKSVIDYIIVPTHRYERGRLEADAEYLDSAA